MKISFKSVIGTAALLLLVSCSETYTVEELRTAEILQILSSDDLKGRHALSPEIKLAEQFIYKEFESAG
ncbi:MAG: hypothetical protein ACPGGA_05385, partial [Balneolaceae bacterium]